MPPIFYLCTAKNKIENNRYGRFKPSNVQQY